MIRKVLFCASSILFLQVIFLFVFKVDLRAFTRCYVDGTLIGDMHTWDSYGGYPFLVKGGSGTVEFAAYKGVVNKNEVQFRPGGGAWTPYSFLQIQVSRDRYFLDFSVPDNDNCGPWWTNTDFHYIVDGKHHYCDDFTVKYKKGFISSFVDATCLNLGGCTMPGITANTRQAGFHNGYNMTIYRTPGEICENYKFCIENGISTNCGAFRDYTGKEACEVGFEKSMECMCEQTASRFSWPVSGKLKAYITKPPAYHYSCVPDPEYCIADPVQLYELINNDYCGGCLDCAPITTPTPAIPVGCTTVMSQISWSGGSGQSLLNNYANNQSAQFTSTQTGNVDKAEIYAYTDRDITKGGKLLYCKLVEGNCSTSAVESTPYDGPYSANVNTWMRMYFPVLIPIINGEEYRLCCRVNHLWGGGALYWINGPVGDLTNRPRKLYVCLTTPTPTPTSTSTPTPTPTATPIPSAVAWLQTKEGDIHAGGEMRSPIPATATNRNFSTNDVGNYPGIITYGTTASFGSGFPSASTAGHWLVQTTGFRKYYDYFYSILDSPILSSPPPGGDIPQASVEASVDGILAYDGNISVPGSGWTIGSRKAVVLTTGKFLIKGRITIDVANGGSLVVIAKDSIGIDKNLVANGPGSRFFGIFVTDETLYSSINPDFGFTPANSNKQLVIDGQVIARAFNLGRDLGAGAGGNNTTAAETFRYNPGLVMNSHQDIWSVAHVWKELTP